MEQHQKQIFYKSAFVAGTAFGTLNFVLNIINGYLTLGLDPNANPVLNISTYGPIFICLISLGGGLVGTWLYAKNCDLPLKVGQGAGLGAVTGFAMVIVALVLDLIWSVINPEFYDNIFKHMITIIENSEMPREQQQMFTDQLYTSTKSKFSLSSIFFNILGGSFMALLNALTGMLGVKLYINEPDEF